MDATTEYEITEPVSLGLKRRGSDNEKRETKTKLRRRSVQRRYFLRSKAHNEKLNKELKVIDIYKNLITQSLQSESLQSDFSYSPSTPIKETATGSSNEKTDSRIGRGSIKYSKEKKQTIEERDWSTFPIFGSTQEVDKDESHGIYTDDGNSKENSDALDEQRFQEIKNDEENSDDENSITSEPVINDERGTKQELSEYIYRILRFDENCQNGLRPKNIFSGISLQQHVERGSKGQESRYISCCKTLDGIERLGGLTNEYQRVREVVQINITKLKDRARIIDLTKEEIRERHISRYSTAWGFAEKFEEVNIDPTSHVPSECVEKIGVVHMRRFKKT
ncbi:uncharacterized protein LOC134241868 [Saccostrea cucullata]|uniref:uncharacterized protein LOC134241868 n=1 Tax=Saccostrea cuccullata TaxID=36930 RepID=UPI002ED5FBD4